MGRRSLRLAALALISALSILSSAAAVPGVADTGAPVWRFERIALSADPGFDARIGAVAHDGTRWWLAGSFIDTGGQHRPGLWSSPDAVTWTQTATQAYTPYGEVSELYTLAATPQGLVAIGMATGGAHGNPRTVSWVLQGDGMLHEAPAAFELYNGPRQIGVRTISSAPGGWVIMGTRNNRNGSMGATSWTSATGDDFTIHDDDPALSSAPGEQVQGLDVARQGDQLLAVGERFAATNGHADTNGIAFTSADGVTWQRWTPTGLDLGGPGAQRPQRIAVLGRRVLIGGTVTSSRTSFLAWTATGSGAWTRTRVPALGSSDDVLSNVSGVAVTQSAFYLASRTGERLRLARSADGRRWTAVPVPRDLPTGARARLTLAGTDALMVLGAGSEHGGGAWRAVPVTGG